MVVWSSVASHLLVGAGSAFAIYKIFRREFSFQYIPYGITIVYSLAGISRSVSESTAMDGIYNTISEVQDCLCLPCLATHYMLKDNDNKYLCYVPPSLGSICFLGLEGLELESIDTNNMHIICCIWGLAYNILHDLKSRWWCSGGAALYSCAYFYGFYFGDLNILTAIDIFNILYFGFILCEILQEIEGDSSGQGGYTVGGG